MGPRLVAQVAYLAPSFGVPFQGKKGHFKNRQHPWFRFNWWFAAAFGLLVECQSPCMSGFERKADRVCHATVPCGPGEARGEDLFGHPSSGSTEDTAGNEFQADTGGPDGDEDHRCARLLVWASEFRHIEWTCSDPAASSSPLFWTPTSVL
jgi:hypothetical protein